MAKNEQKSFILFLDSYDDISLLNQEQKGDLLDGIYAFHGACECPELDQATEIVLRRILRYLEENRENGWRSATAGKRARRNARSAHARQRTPAGTLKKRRRKILLSVRQALWRKLLSVQRRSQRMLMKDRLFLLNTRGNLLSVILRIQRNAQRCRTMPM